MPRSQHKVLIEVVDPKGTFSQGKSDIQLAGQAGPLNLCRTLLTRMSELACSSDHSSVRMRDLISLSTPPPCILQESLTPSPEPGPQWQTSELC